MANSKIQLADGTVLLDLTSDTVDAEHLMQGYTAHDKAGNSIIGTNPGGGANVPKTTSLLKGDGSGGIKAATPGTDYLTSATYVINVTNEGDVYSADKSYSQIRTAYENGREVIANYNGDQLRLGAVFDSNLVFERVLYDDGFIASTMFFMQDDDSAGGQVSTGNVPTAAQIIAWNAKQNALTPGDGLSITDNVISLDLDNYDGGAF